ncbi:hypothetical protein GCM10010321_57970 [Streptomyces chartreusis]|nr:hypothetical protein GCM10010321_57970 [Streptomyces chartreusis]
MAEAVKDTDLRVLLDEAEKRLLRNDPADSIRKSQDAFRVAYDHWRKQYRRRTPFHHEPMSHEVLDTKGYQYLKREVSEVNDASVAMALSGDPGEYVWFRDVTANPEAMDVATLDEAQRALGFVFGWITRWESFQESFIPDRWYQRQAEQRRIRSSSVCASVSDVRVRGEQGKFLIEVDLMDVPPNDEFNVWRDILTRLVSDGLEPKGWCKVTDSGQLTIWLTKEAELPSGLADQISTALLRVEDEIAQKRSESEASRNALRAEADSYEESYEAAKEGFPAWVERVWLTEFREIRGGQPQSRLMFSVTPEARHFWRNISSDLPARSDVESCILDSSEGAFRVSPQISVEELCSVLQSISEEIEGLIVQEVNSENAKAELRRSLESELRAKFRL